MTLIIRHCNFSVDVCDFTANYFGKAIE